MTAQTLTPEQQQEAREAALAELVKGWRYDILLPRDETVAIAAYAAGLARGRAEERERCAKVCEKYADDKAAHGHWPDIDGYDDAFNDGAESGAKDCADAIRAAGAEEAGS